MDIPQKARAVIIGGGVAGCAAAYHLAKLGWKDIVLLERKQLTCGTTWHAAGLLPRLRPTKTLTDMAQYGHELYAGLEKETGAATGYKQSGSLSVALTAARAEELRRGVSAAKAFGVPAEEIAPDDAAKLYPGLKTDDVLTAAWFPQDAQGDPVNIALALAKGAKMRGVKIIEGAPVLRVLQKNGRACGVETAAGEIIAEHVVCAAGMWTRDFCRRAGVAAPLYACEHFYIVTAPVPGLPPLPVLRVADECAYYKEDAGKILLGAFEPRAKPLDMEKITADFCFDSLPEDYGHFEPILQKALARLPLLEKAGVQTFFNGPESFTPDGNFLLGESPELQNFYLLAGFNSMGIQLAGGAGKALAEWMDSGAPPMDLWASDIRRIMPFQANRCYLRERASETLGLLYADHFPHRQKETARNIRHSPLHERLAARGACFGELAGWERANWFLPKKERLAGEKPAYHYSWGRQNWFEYQRAEHMAARAGTALFDLSSLGKIRVVGADAATVLQKIAANQMDTEPGRVVYTPFLNAVGGIVSDATTARISETEFALAVPAAAARRDLAWIRRHIPDSARCAAVDTTAAEAVLLVTGPQSREFLRPLLECDISAEAFPFAAARETGIAGAAGRAQRISFAGELGWELHIAADMARHVFDALMARAEEMPLVLGGMHALDSCRVEKGFRHAGHDISEEDHVLEAGLGFAVCLDKGKFIGREAVLRKRESGLLRRLAQFQLQDAEPMLHHCEPIWRDGKIAGYISGGNYGHALGAAAGLGYARCRADESAAEMLESRYEIEIAGKKFAARASFRPLYDPSGARMKS